ncbi:MAG TPA: hypothetical protein V6D48_18845 [Oculatellaceae cyanobacterium]
MIDGKLDRRAIACHQTTAVNYNRQASGSNRPMELSQRATAPLQKAWYNPSRLSDRSAIH